ncbi:hypothetical protein HDU99_002484 [Rhizoclosmatium hyalinum]|nr:hypothetical protein HDU99_002484 [Rhizoclosmatium hyalinum]
MLSPSVIASMAPKTHMFVPKRTKKKDTAHDDANNVFGIPVPRTNTNESTFSVKSVKSFFENIFRKGD